MATITGTNRVETLLGKRDEDDTILSLGGNDFLYGLGGNDLLQGGAGDDSYRFDVGDGRDVVTDLEGMNSIYFVSTTRGNFAELTSSNFSSNDSDLVISFMVGESSQQVTLTNYYLSPSSFTIFYNTSYLGRLSEVSLADIPVGRDGSEGNSFLATAAADTFTGSAGFDWVSYEGSTAGVSVELRYSPADTDRSWATDDTLTDIDNLIGSDYGDYLVGNGATNILRGGGGNDLLLGLAGNDRLEGGAGDDYLFGGVGADTLEGGAGADTLAGGPSTDRLEGGAGDDTIIGGDGGDFLNGGDGADRLAGGAGDDYLYGNRGADKLDGGAGADTYHFFLGDGIDTIEDVVGDSMTLLFAGSGYRAADFAEGSNNFNRVGNDLVITIDKDSEDGVTDKVTIVDAYDSDSNSIGNAAFTINVEYGSATEVTVDFWHYLA